MTIDQADRIDVVGVERASGKLVMTIADHRDWSDWAQHLASLYRKIDYYVEVTRSADFSHAYPQAVGRQVVICLRSLHGPPPEAHPALASLASRLEEGDKIEFRIIVGKSGERLFLQE